MARNNRGTVISGRTKLVVALFFFVILPLYIVFGQVGELNEGISVSISPKRPSLGENFKYEIMVRGNFFSSVTVIPPVYLGGFKILEGPYIRPNVEENGIIITYVLKALRKGERILRSFTVKVNSDVYKTPSLKIDVISIRPTVYWRVEREEYFVGEVFPVTLELVLWDKLAIPLGVDTRAPVDSWFEEFVSGETLKHDNLDGKERFMVPLKSFLVTFGKTGRFRIPPARVILPGRIRLYTPLKVITVRSLPSKVKPTYAVGSFDYSYKLSDKSVELGKSLRISITVAGVGNFNYFKFPVPTIRGVKGIVVENDEEVKPTINGYAGFRRVVYLFKPKNSGNFYCTIPDFPYLDRTSKNVKILKGGRYLLSVNLPVKKATTEITFPLKTYSEFVKSNKKPLLGKWFTYLLFLPGPLLYLLVLLFRRYRKKRQSVIIMAVLFLSLLFFQSADGGDSTRESISGNVSVVKEIFSRASKAYANKNYTLSGKLFEKLEKSYPENRVLLYNIAVCYYQNKDTVRAMHVLRELLRKYPSEEKARKFLRILETKLSLTDQIPPSLDVNPERLLNILIVLFNLLFIFIIAYTSNRRIGFLFSSFLIGIGFLVVLGYLGYSYYYTSKARGVVATERGYVLRIPERTSTIQNRVVGGTSVNVLGRAKEYVLVKTGNGSEGWIPSKDILLD